MIAEEAQSRKGLVIDDKALPAFKGSIGGVLARQRALGLIIEIGVHAKPGEANKRQIGTNVSGVRIQAFGEKYGDATSRKTSPQKFGSDCLPRFCMHSQLRKIKTRRHANCCERLKNSTRTLPIIKHSSPTTASAIARETESAPDLSNLR